MMFSDMRKNRDQIDPTSGRATSCTAMSYELSWGCAESSAIAGYRRTLRPRGFTLTEILVVITILVILMGLAVVGGQKLIDSSRRKSTLATMQVLEQAIVEYGQEGALGGRHSGRYGSHPPDGFTYDAEGDRLSNPRIEQIVDSEGDMRTVWTKPDLIEDYNGNQIYDGAYLNLDFLGDHEHAELEVQERDGDSWRSKPQLSPDEPMPETYSDHHSIEAFYLYATHFSPAARSILQKLPGEFVTNADTRDGAAVPDRLLVDADGEDGFEDTIDLLEITDAWGVPLRYAVHHRRVGGFQWELRSAGGNEQFNGSWFATRFRADERDDDVVLRRP